MRVSSDASLERASCVVARVNGEQIPMRDRYANRAVAASSPTSRCVGQTRNVAHDCGTLRAT